MKKFNFTKNDEQLSLLNDEISQLIDHTLDINFDNNNIEVS